MSLIVIKDVVIAFLSHKDSIQLLGLVFDITGAFYLSKAFIFKSPSDIKSETFGSANQRFLVDFGMSGNLFCSFYTQGIEARIGFTMLFLGFSFQGVGLIWPWIMVSSGFVIFAWILSVIFCQILCNHLTNIKRVKKILNRDER